MTQHMNTGRSSSYLNEIQLYCLVSSSLLNVFQHKVEPYKLFEGQCSAWGNHHMRGAS